MSEKPKSKLRRIFLWIGAVSLIIILIPIVFFLSLSYFPRNLQVEKSTIAEEINASKTQYIVWFSLDEKLSGVLMRKPEVQVVWATLRSCGNSEVYNREVAAQWPGSVPDGKRVQYLGINPKTQRHDYQARFDATLNTRIYSTSIVVDARDFEQDLCFQLTGGGMAAMVRSNKVRLSFSGKYPT